MQAAEMFIVAFVRDWSFGTLWDELRRRGISPAQNFIPQSGYFAKRRTRRVVALQWPKLNAWLIAHEGCADIFRAAPEITRLKFLEDQMRGSPDKEFTRAKSQVRYETKKSDEYRELIDGLRDRHAGRGWGTVKGVRAK